MNWETVGQIRRLESSRNAIDGLELFDFLAAIGRMEVAELPRLRQNVAFERANGLILFG